ncbi:MAG TPA: hypothetical protein VMC62_11830 [Longilinea sp.]|nr:hypothetical protein [Longilinea sp.]
MRKTTIAFLYNVRHKYPDPDNPKSHLEADFDDPETIESIIDHFKKCNYRVLPIEANENAYTKLKRNRYDIDLAFNYSLGMYGTDHYAQIPAMCDMLRIPYTGSGPLTEALVLYKAKMKEVLAANHVPTLPFQLFKVGDELLDRKLHFPLIVKPVAQGSSAGITNASVVDNETDLRDRIAYEIKTFKAAALVEPFLTGREFSIGLWGNPPDLETLPVIEADHATLPEGYLPLDSLEVKWVIEEEAPDHLICPADIPARKKNELESICLKTWQALGILDWCRIDLRCDTAGHPYVLDVNSPPGMIPPEVSLTSYFPLAARAAGIDFDTFLQVIVETALKRYHKRIPKRVQ